MKTAILQPFIPHYREEFFELLTQKIDCDVYCYESNEKINLNNFQQSKFKTKHIKSKFIGPFLWYNLGAFFDKNTDKIVLMLDFKHITTWILLLTKFLHGKNVILWGQGISVKRYIQEEKKPSLLLKWMIFLADGVWFYTDKELQIWKKNIPGLKAVSLENTISDIRKIIDIPGINKKQLKTKYNIQESIVLIFCARFNSFRRIDILLELIKKLDNSRYGFIIIGEGKEKPSFSSYKNVYDFGSIYDFHKKTELFHIADIYLQPAWVGLSIVEAMAYRKPVFTFKRSKDLLQCVEYNYIIDDYNGKIFGNIKDCIIYINNINKIELERMGENALTYAKDNLMMDNMVEKAISLL